MAQDPKTREPEEKQAERSRHRAEAASVGEGIQDSDTRKKFLAAQGEGKMSDADLDAQTYRVRNQLAAGIAPTLHKGGVVKKDGLHNLEKGEIVIPKDEAMKKSGLIDGMKEAADEKAEPKDKKKKDGKHEKPVGKSRYKHTHIIHHDDGSHTVSHTPHADENGKQGEDTTYATPDMDGVHDGLEEHVGEPNPGEAEADSGNSGIEGEQAPPQGA